MIKTIQKCPGRTLVALLIAVSSCAIMACSPESNQQESQQFTADELYLITAYVDVRRAASNYPYRPDVGDSLFTGLSASVDTVRIAHTIAALNLDPDRWAAVYQEIENRLRNLAREKDLEGSGAGSGTPTQVE